MPRTTLTPDSAPVGPESGRKRFRPISPLMALLLFLSPSAWAERLSPAQADAEESCRIAVSAALNEIATPGRLNHPRHDDLVVTRHEVVTRRTMVMRGTGDRVAYSRIH